LELIEIGETMSYYLVRIGAGSKYVEEAYKNDFIAVGWDEVPDLKKLGTLEAIKKALTRTSYGYSDSQIAAQSGQLYRFGMEMKNGDVVLSPKGKGEYLVGIVGDYYFEDNPQGTCDYKHRRKMEWQKEKIILKEDMSTNLAYAVGAILTIFSLDKYAKEFDALIAGEVFTPAEKPQRIRDMVLAGLLELDGEEFEHFIKHLLDILGFNATVTRYVKDKGIDVIGILNAEGLAEIKLQVQAKRYDRGSVGERAIRELKGSLSLDEHGCIITTSFFNEDAVEEASKAGHKTIKLIDGEDLAAIILKHYDEIDDGYKKRFGIKRKKDFNIEEQFEIAYEIPEDIKEMEAKEKILKPKWDTVVCAAKEDGFKRAFLGQKAWWAVRLSPKTLSFIKYIAIYQVAPISQITYYGKVSRIEPFESAGKYKLYLDGEPIKLAKPVVLGQNHHLKPQGPKYTSLEKILKAKTLDDIFNK
jgi:predicted Mrr-cat superfamily restriction endonuclease